jgi:hypothetical protein
VARALEFSHAKTRTGHGANATSASSHWHDSDLICAMSMNLSRRQLAREVDGEACMGLARRHHAAFAVGHEIPVSGAARWSWDRSPAREARGSGNSSAGAEPTFFSQFMASERTRPSQPFGGRTFRMKAMVRARSTISESPYLPGLIQLGPYIARGTLVSYDHGDPWVEA